MRLPHVLDGVRLFHAIDARALYSAGLVCSDLSLYISLQAFETVLLSPFWSPASVQADGAFKHE